MDFIIGLSKSKWTSSIMVVVDLKTKYAPFCSLPHPFKESIMEIVQKLHGVSKITISDRDPFFTRNFWPGLFSYLGAQMAHNLSHHPKYLMENLWLCINV